MAKEKKFEERKFISHYQAAELLGLSAPTVYRLTDRGKIASYRVGKGSYLDEAEVRKYKNQKRNNNA